MQFFVHIIIYLVDIAKIETIVIRFRLMTAAAVQEGLPVRLKAKVPLMTKKKKLPQVPPPQTPPRATRRSKRRSRA